MKRVFRFLPFILIFLLIFLPIVKLVAVFQTMSILSTYDSNRSGHSGKTRIVLDLQKTMAEQNSEFFNPLRGFRNAPPPPPSLLEFVGNQTFGGSDIDYGFDIVEVSTGGFALAGYTRSFAESITDMWLVRTDPAGTLLWNRTFSGSVSDSVRALVEVRNGGFILIGNTYNVGTSWEDVWLVRTDANGNHLWNRTFGGTGNDYGRDLVEVRTGGFVLMGSTNSMGAGGSDMWLIRTDANGNHLWNRTFGGTGNDYGNTITEVRTGGFVLAGDTRSFGSGGQDLWLVKTDGAGNHLWNRTFGGAADDSNPSLVEVRDGGFVLAGTTLSFGAGNSDWWVIKTDRTGNHLWNRTFGGTNFDTDPVVIEPHLGGFAIGGSTQSFGFGEWDMWLVRTDSNGNQLSNQTFGSIGSDNCYSLVERSTGGYALVGMTNSFGAGAQDMWLVFVGSDYWWGQYFGLNYPDIGGDLVEVSTGGFAINGRTQTITTGNEDGWLVHTNTNGVHIWNQTYGGWPQDDFLGSFVECSDGGFAIAGWSGIDGAGGADAWLIRTFPNGTLQWQKAWGTFQTDTAFSVIEVSSGGFALVGQTQGYTVDNNDQVWLIRTDANGNHLWNKTFGGPNLDLGYSIVECDSGGFAIVGWTTSFGAGSRDVWLIRTDASGNHLWNQTFGGLNDDVVEHPNSLIELPDGGFAITGWTETWSAGMKDVWLVRTDASGNHLWNQSYGALGNEVGFSITQMSSGGFTIAGYTNSSGAGIYDGWLLRINSTGSLLWNHTFGGTNGDHFGSIVESRTGGIAVAGAYESSGSTGKDFWLVRIQPVQWDAVPTDQSLMYNSFFQYEINASALYGVDSWWLNDSINFIIDGSGVITNASTLGPEGTRYGLKVYVNDTFGDFCMATFSVMVLDTTAPNWIETPTTQVVELGASFRYDLNATDPAGISHWWLNDTVHFSIDIQGVMTNTTFVSVEIYGIQVWVNDTFNNILTSSFSVIIQDSIPPTWDQIPMNQLIEAGDIFQYDVNASDLAGINLWWLNDTINFSIDSNGVIINSSSLVTGNYSIEVRGYDPSNNYCTAEFTVTVQDTKAPTWRQTPVNQTLEFGLSFKYDLNATDPSGIDLYWLNDTTHFIIDNSGIITEVMPLSIAVYTLEVRAYDPYGHWIVATFKVIVQDTTSPTWNPEPSNQVAELGNWFQYRINATDLSGTLNWWINDTVNFRITTLIDPLGKNGYIENATLLNLGLYALEVRAYDSSNNYCSYKFTISVEDTTPPYWIVAPTDAMITYGSTLDIPIRAADISSISGWYLNDSTHFDFQVHIIGIKGDLNGSLQSVGVIPPGIYGLALTIMDIHDNVLYTTITITVVPVAPPPIPGFPFIAIVIGLLLALSSIIIYRVEKYRKGNDRIVSAVVLSRIF